MAFNLPHKNAVSNVYTIASAHGDTNIHADSGQGNRNGHDGYGSYGRGFIHAGVLLHNPEMNSYTADAWILLEVNDHFRCNPSWISLKTAVDFAPGIEVVSSSSYYEEVLNFEWPDTEVGIECMFFVAAFEPGRFDFIGNYRICIPLR